MDVRRSPHSSRASITRSRSWRWGRSPSKPSGGGANSAAPGTSAIRLRGERPNSAPDSEIWSPEVYSLPTMIEALVSPAARTTAHPLDRLDTPALLLDADKLERNCRAMRERTDKHHVTLRPHVKTGKSVEVAQCALGAA